jgi:hypothetical protein
MSVADGKAICRNGSCKNFGVEFVAPDLELNPVNNQADFEAPSAPAAAAEAPAAEPESTEAHEG